MSKISVVIYTKNEEFDLQGCLDKLSWCDDVHVFDSGSSDRTIEIAKKFGAIVTVRDYGFGAQAFGGDESAHRNWALDNLPLKNEWIYFSDADERVTPDLISSLLENVNNPRGNVAFRVRRRDYFMGTWLRHVTPSPFNIRLVKRDKVRYQRLINPVCVVDGTVGDISEHFDHFPFSKGMSHWFSKHNLYSTKEAEQIVSNRKQGASFSFIKMFFSEDKNLRRYHQKEFYYRLPLRPFLMFFILYFLKMGFMDGRAGFTYSVLRSIYEYMISLKVDELESLS